MSISPARKTLEMKRGETREFTVNFVNQAETSNYEIEVNDFYYEPSGSTRIIEPDELADPSQSMREWVELDPVFEAVKGVRNSVNVTVSVPEFATYGDHYGMLVFKKAASEGGAVLSIQGGISLILFVKVLGGEQVKSGSLVDFSARSQQRARNPVNFMIEYKNTGNQFFRVLAEVQVFEEDGDSEAIKRVQKDVLTFPNVQTSMKLALGDLGDDYGERKYFALLRVYEFDGATKGQILSEEGREFDYYLPYTGDDFAEPEVQRPVVVDSPIVTVLRELGLYIGGFILLVIVLIRVLFFQTVPRAGKRSSKKKK